MWKPSGRVWWRARARPPDGESSSMPFVETSISNHATPRLIHLRPGAKCFERPEKGSPILRGADSAATGPSTDKAQRSAVFLLFQFPSLPAYLRYSSLSATRHLRPRFCAQIPTFPSRLALSPPPTTSSRPPPFPLLSSRSRTASRLHLLSASSPFFSAEEFSTIQVGVPLLCPPPSRLGGSVADTWLGQLAPGLAVETWSPTAAASPSLHSAPLRLKLLTHPRGANSNPGSPSDCNSLLLRGLARPTPSRASHTSTAPDPALTSPYLIRPPCRLIGHPLNLLPD